LGTFPNILGIGPGVWPPSLPESLHPRLGSVIHPGYLPKTWVGTLCDLSGLFSDFIWDYGFPALSKNTGPENPKTLGAQFVEGSFQDSIGRNLCTKFRMRASFQNLPRASFPGTPCNFSGKTLGKRNLHVNSFNPL